MHKAHGRKRHALEERGFASRAFDVVNYLVFGIFTLMCVYPFYYIFINTISDNTLTARGLVMFYPIGVHFSNYVQVLKIAGLAQATLISVARTVLGTGLTVFASAFVGYLVTKEKMWHRKFWYRFIIATMYFNAGIIPWYILMMNLHLTNNFLAYIIPGIVSPFNIILVKTYVESIPAALEEAALLDGANELQILVYVIMPLSTAVIAVIAMYYGVGYWNSWYPSLMFQRDRNLFPLQMFLREVLITNQSTSVAKDVTMQSAEAFDRELIKYCMVIISTVPILCIYPFLQRYFVKGVMVGAIKG